jgi:hypothetical protein
MGYVVGLALAIVVGAFASLVRLDRDRAFYPTVMIVIATYYLLFAATAGSLEVLAREAIPVGAFVLVAVLGFRHSLWLVVAALLGHGAFDLVHGHVISNPGVPMWWPSFCLAYDVAAGLYLAWLLLTRRVAVAST